MNGSCGDMQNWGGGELVLSKLGLWGGDNVKSIDAEEHDGRWRVVLKCDRGFTFFWKEEWVIPIDENEFGWNKATCLFVV